MKRLVSNKRGEVSYGQKWQNTESSSDSESDYDDGGCDRHSQKVAAAHEDNEVTIPKVKKRVEVTVKDGGLMHASALKGDWVAAEVLLERDPNLAFEYVTEEGDRALHVATAMKHKEFVKNLSEGMSEEQLLLLDGHGYTACCYAAVSGEVEIARLIIGNRPKLVTARDEEKVTPLRKAALRGKGRMLSFLLEYAEGGDLPREEWFDLLLDAIRGKMFGAAIDIMGKNGSIARMANEDGTALHQLARVDSLSEISMSSLLLEIIEGELDKGEHFSLLLEFRELAEKVWVEMRKMEKASLVELIEKPAHVVHDAAKSGHVVIITTLTRSFPNLIWVTDSNGYTVFHLAVMYRQSSVFDLVHQVEPMLRSITTWQDRRGDNILHLAARSAAVTQVNLPPAHQLQWELQWFKAVKEIVPPSCLMMRNGKGQTPEMLLSRTHKKLLRESRTWMINKADSSMLIATILLTVVFAAAFTVPGGYASQTGEPVLSRKNWFKAFVVFEVLSIMFSVVSIIMFQSIMCSSFAEDEFLSTLPFLQRAGFQSLLMSLATAFLAFMASISLFNINMSGLVWFGFSVLCVYGSIWALIETGNRYLDNSMNKKILRLY